MGELLKKFAAKLTHSKFASNIDKSFRLLTTSTPDGSNLQQSSDATCLAWGCLDPLEV